MNRPLAKTTAWALALALACVAGATPRAAWATPGLQTILHCTFNDKTVDQPIGIGGPTVGEPITLGDVPAIVRAAPFDTPSLELTEDWGFGARHVRFEFLNGTAISAGMLDISFRLYFPALNAFTIYLREVSFSSVSFLNMGFSSDGSIFLQALGDPVNNFVGSYAAGQAIPFHFVFDLDARTYSAFAGETPLVQDAALDPLPKGIGAFLIGLDHDSDSEGTVFLDDLLIQATAAPDPVAATTWGGVKALFAR